MDKGRILTALLLAGKSAADLHHLFTSSFATPHLYSLEFNDEKSTLIDIANLTAHDGHPWISFSYDKSSLYAGEVDGFASYAVENSTSLLYSQSVKVQAECGGKKDGMGSPYVVAELRAPFTVFGASSSSCGAAMSVDPDGKLQSLVQSYKYKDGSSIKGLALDPDNKYLYSADEANNGIWVHLVNDQGTVNQVGFTASPIANSGPRHLIVHPDGKYLYAVFARTNVVAVFAINSGKGSDTNRLAYTGMTYSLTPPGAADGDFSGEDVLLSVDANVLFATTRFVGQAVPPPKTTSTPGWQWGPGNDDDDDDNSRVVTVEKRATRPGYITAILLTPLAEHESPLNNRVVGSGFPLRQIFQLATTTSGGNSNSISPAPWSSDFFALADSEFGLVEIWKINNLGSANYSGSLAVGARSAPVGGWVQNNWARNGYLVTPANLVPDEANNQGQPRTTVTVTQAPTAAPTAALPWSGLLNGWRPGQSSGSSNDPWGRDSGSGSSSFPWGRGGDDNDDRRLRSGSDRSSSSSSGWETAEQSDDERRRKYVSSWTWEPETPVTPAPKPSLLSNIFNWITNRRVQSVGKRQLFGFNSPSQVQAQAQPQAQGPPITARIVASWRAPIGGGSPGRLYTDTRQRYMPPHVMRVKPWTGSKKRDVKEEVHENAEVPTAPTQEQLASYIKAQSQGKSCCANAAWFD